MANALDLLNQQRWPQALAAAREAFDPGDPETRRVLGLACAFAGHLDEAAEHLAAALQSGKGPAQSWQVLAAVQLQRGDAAGELFARRRAVEAAPGDADLWLHLASSELDGGDGDAALASVIRALDLQDSVTARRLFVALMADHRRATPELRGLVKRALAESWGRPTALFNAALAIVRSTGARPEQDDLLAELLVSGPMQNAGLEAELTALRRTYLLEGRERGGLLDVLARQGWINEYCWAVSGEEQAALAALPADSPLLTLYRDPEQPAPVPDIPRLTDVREGVSAAVQAMYEENPYPRWIRLAGQDPRPLEGALRSTFPRVAIAPIPGADILVAGCGTGQHALQVARRYSDAKVLAVDLSLASLSYAMRKARELGVANVAFGQADILELPRLGRTFSAISCAGTLQAMADPMAGFRVLVDLLKPGGVLHLGLYSRIARAELSPAKALAAAFPPTPDGIRALRQAIRDLPDADPARAVLAWSDFYATSMVRDLLMHVQESQSSMSDIRALIRTSGLRFLGFELEPEVQRAYRLANPGDVDGSDLDGWEAFEQANPRAFRGMYQFWMQRPPAGAAA